jgi:predicted DNA-binding transcriptional regulator AlpA
MNTENQTDNLHRRIPAAAVLEMCGGVSAMTLHRWLNNPDLDFPRPHFIGRRRYWRESDVVAWLDAQADKTAA